MNSRVARAAATAAGPALIVASVVLVLRDYVFRGLLHVGDALTLWLPTYCYLGKSLAGGHIPAWNPHVMAGIPFAADPQSGWMNLSAMTLFAALPCGVAIGAYLILQPILAGLALFWFLRIEGARRPAATIGGLVLALGIAGSGLAIALPFSAAMAWTATMLATASRFAHAETRLKRLVWALLTALAWGQIVAALLSEGLVIGTGALVAYAVASVVRSRARPSAALQWGSMLLVLVPVNLAYLLPRLAYLPRTTLGLGYARLDEAAASLSGQAAVSSSLGGSAPGWPLNFAVSPGLHLGAVALALSFAGLWSKRHRHLVVAFGVYAAAFYVASLEAVANAIPDSIRDTRLADFYLHAPQRFGYAVPLALAVLAPCGVEAWLERPSARRRALMLVPGLLLWFVLPPALGADPARLELLGFASAGAAVALVLANRRPALVAVLPAAVAAELVLNGITGSHAPGARASTLQPFQPKPAHVVGLPDPTASVRGYLTAGPIARAIQKAGEGRYMALGTQAEQELAQRTGGFGMLDQAMVFDTQNAGGYNSVQLERYWRFVRAVQGEPIQYNRALFVEAPPLSLNLLQVRFVLAPARMAALYREVLRQNEWVLYELPTAAPLVSLVQSWQVVDGPAQALGSILTPGFDPDTGVVLEQDPGLVPDPTGTGGRPSSSLEELGPQALSIDIRSASPVMVLIRNSFDPNWHAEVDGRPVPVLVADSFLQAVAVPAGRHTVDLTYHDPWIGYGLLGSGLAFATVLAGAAVMVVRTRRTAPRGGRDEEELRRRDSNPHPSA